MRFRPCIDIHNGKIKQIVGGSLLDQGDFATENFVSEKDGTFYGKLYKENHLNGGHIIMLNARDSKYYEEDKVQALKALKAFEGGLQISPVCPPEFLQPSGCPLPQNTFPFFSAYSYSKAL